MLQTLLPTQRAPHHGTKYFPSGQEFNSPRALQEAGDEHGTRRGNPFLEPCHPPLLVFSLLNRY